MKKILITSFFFSSIFAFSQAQLNSSSRNVEFFSMNAPVVEKAKGSPYLIEDFKEASIIGFEGTYFVRYNANAEKMEVRIADKVRVVPTTNIKAVNIKKSYVNVKKTYHPLSFEANKTSFGLLIWADDKGNALYAREYVAFFPLKKAASSYGKDSPARYERAKDRYYIKMADGDVKELVSKKKKFFSALSGKEKEVEAFVKKQKLRIDKEGDLKRIMAFYFS